MEVFMQRSIGAMVAASCLACCITAYAQPAGPQFQVNTYTTSFQRRPSIAGDAAGNFVVVWNSFGSGTDSDYSVQGQRFDGTGAPQGTQFQVNTYTTGYEFYPAVASDAGGNFVVVWERVGTPDSITGQLFDSSGAPIGGEFQIETYTTGNKARAAVAADAAGNFLVVWESAGSLGTDPSASIQGRLYDGSGTPQGTQFQVNTYTTSSQLLPSVAADGVGNFAVAWSSGGSAGSDTGSLSIQAQRYDATGAALGSEFQVNTYTTGQQHQAAVAADGAGNFVIAWQSYGGFGSDNSSSSIQAQRYDGTGAAIGGQFQVNTYTTASQSEPTVAMDAGGNFVMIWQGPRLQGQRFDSAGLPQGVQFLMNNSIPQAAFPAVAVDGGGTFMVAWDSLGSTGSDSSGYSIQAQFVAVSTTSSSSASSSSTSSTSTSTTTSSSSTSSTLPTTDLLPVKLAIIKAGTLAKFVAKPLVGTFAPPAGNPFVSGGSLRFYDVAFTAGDDTYPLAAGGSWTSLGNPPGSKGFKYRGAGSPSDPCKVVLIKQSVIKAVCKGTGITLQPPFTGEVGIVLTLGATDRYCAEVGGMEIKNDPDGTKRKDAPAPGGCP